MRRWSWLIVLLWVSCSGAPSPRLAAEGYLGALANLDFGTASRFVSDEGRQAFEALRALSSQLPTEEREKFRLVDWSITAEAVTGDTALVDFTFDGTKKGQLRLTRTSGVWRVDHRKTL